MIKQFNLFKFVSSCVNFGIFSSVFFLHQIFLFILFSSLSFLAWYCQFNHWLINLYTFLIPASFSFFFFPISWSSSFSNVTPCHTSSFSFCFSSISPISPLLLLENCGHQESIRHLRCHVGVSTRTYVRVNVVCVYKSVCVYLCVYVLSITLPSLSSISIQAVYPNTILKNHRSTQSQSHHSIKHLPYLL